MPSLNPTTFILFWVKNNIEVARVELFRSIGISYDEIEKLGFWLPVSEYKIKYLKPAFYDEILEIHTYVKKIPGVRIEFEYEIYNQSKQKIYEYD